MKERFKQIRKVVNGAMVFCYVKEQKKHWWSNWKTVMKEGAPLLFYKLPEGVKAVNELPHFKINEDMKTYKHDTASLSNISTPLPIFPKGDKKVRWSMIEMVRNADEVYIGIKQDGQYYVAYDTESRQSINDLQSLEFDDEE